MRNNAFLLLIVSIITASLFLFDLEAVSRNLYPISKTLNYVKSYGVGEGEYIPDISEYKTVKVKRDEVFLQKVGATYLGTSKTLYIISDTFDLNGETIDLPRDCVLKFKSKGCLRNGTVNGSNTHIISKNVCFDNVKLTGSFSNPIGHLYWFKKTEDISSQLLCILNRFKAITIDYGGIISEILPRIDTTSVIDGRGSVIRLYAPSFIWSGTAGQKSYNDIDIKNITIDYNNKGFNHNNVQAVSIVTHGRVSITGVTIMNYSNIKGEFSSFEGIAVYPFHDSRVIIKNCSFNNLKVGGDGIVGNKSGACDGIVISHYMMNKVDEHTCGNVVIENCSFDFIQNIGEYGEYILDDAGGITIGMQKDDAYNVSINNCIFKNVSKRNIKIQGNGVKVENIISDFEVNKVPANTTLYCIGSDGSDIIVRNVKGNYPAPFFKNSQGNNCTLEGIDIEAKSLIHIGNDTDYDYTIKNCRLRHATFGVYLSAYNSKSSIYGFSAKPNIGIKVEDCVFEDCATFFFSAKGIFNRQCPIAKINKSKVSCNQILDGGIHQLSFYDCLIDIEEKKIPESVVTPSVNLSLINTDLTVKSNVYSGNKESNLLCASHLELDNCHFRTEDKNEITVVAKTEYNPTCSQMYGDNIIKNCSFEIPCYYDLCFKGVKQYNARIEDTDLYSGINIGEGMHELTLKDVTWGENIILDIEESQNVNKDFIIKAKNIPYELLPKRVFLFLENNPKGTWEQRPGKASVGYSYFCTDRYNADKELGVTLHYKGNGVWVDSKGGIVE